MKYFFIALTLMPTLSFASMYSCAGEGYSLELSKSPLEMKVKGSGVNAMAQDIRILSTFNTILTGKILKPTLSVKLTIKDLHMGNPGDRFNAVLQLSSADGVREYSGIVCSRGNE